MAEPHVSTAAGAAGALTLWGMATGLPVDLILPAFCGALWGLRNLEPGGLLSRVAQVTGGTLLAAWTTPALAALLSGLAPKAVAAEMIRLPLAALVGWGGLGLALPRLARIIKGEEVAPWK